jgi:hypothetical protein
MQGIVAMDWPLSREEKKSQILRLYNDDVRAADNMLSSGEAALEALRDELDTVRRAAGINKPSIPKTTSPAHDCEVERLRSAVESAAAVLRAILPPSEDTGAEEPDFVSSRVRARSEGCVRDSSVTNIRPALCQTPRAKPKRKVSFGGQPEEEPNHIPSHTDSEDEECSKVKPGTPLKPRDSIALQKERICAQEDSDDDSPSATPIDVSRSGNNSGLLARPSLKVHLTWLACSIGIAAVFGKLAFQMGATKTPVVINEFGDPSCWSAGFTPEICCLGGPKGNVHCWDVKHTYERCCLAGLAKKIDKLHGN